MAEHAAVIGEALERWLADRGDAYRVTMRGRANGGLSQETWFVDLALGAAVTQAVLRRPTATSGETALRNQVALLRGLDGTRVPAPRLLWAEELSGHGLDRPFFVMERLPGAAPVGWHDLAPDTQRSLAEQSIDILADLHALSPARIENWEARTPDLNWYRRRFEKLSPLSPVLDAALWWLQRNIPEPTGPPVIVHNDFRMGNLIVADGKVTGVLDWEMTGVGDPLEDLAWCFIPVWDRADVDETAMIRRYERRTGRKAPEASFRWHRALGYVRLIYYALAGARAFDDGHSDDFRLAALRLRLPIQLDRLMAVVSGERLT